MLQKIKARFKTYQLVTALLVVVGLAIVGSILLFPSHAASNLVLGTYEGAGNAAGIAGFAAETKTTVGIAADYESGSTWSSIESGWPAGDWTGMPYLLQLGVPILPSSGGATLADGAAGDYNSYFTTLAQNLVAAGEGNAILRLGWEWDGSYTTWYAAGSTTNATDFATYWQQIVTAMRAVPGANFNYSWYYGAATTDGVPGPATAITNDAYPGDSYVSSISLDYYDQTWTGSCGLPYNITSVPTPASQVLTSTQSQCAWSDGYLPELNGLVSFASSHNKPIGITEWGVITRSDGHGLGDDPAYINNFSTWMKANNVTYASYFDYNPGLSNGGDSLLSSYPNSLAAYSSDFGSSGTTTTTPPVVNPPSIPTSVSATATSSTSVTVSWSASTDTGGPGLGGYNIFRNGSSTKIGTALATATSFTDTSVLPSNTYTYTVEAYDKSSPVLTSNQSSASSPVSTPATPKPSAPTSVSATATSSTSVNVTWSACTGTCGPAVSGYNIYRGGIKINSSLITATSYTDTTAIAGTTYTYTVEAVDASGDSSVASTASAPVTTPPATDTTPPSTPGGVKATINSPTSVTISWNASTDSTGGGGISGYYVLRSTNGGAYTTLNSVTSTSFTDNTVSASTTYSYEIVAFDAAGNSSVNNTAVPVTTPATTVAVQPPAAPVNVSASVVSPSQIDISWGDTSAGVTSFSVYKVGSSTPLASLSDTVTSYGAVGLNASTSYSFYVVAYIGSTSSANSATVSATTQAAPASQTYTAGSITGLASKCLDNNNNNIELYTCNSTGAQKWTYNPANGTITNSNGHCLAVEGNATKSGTPAILWQCDGSSGQVWSVKGVQGVAGAIVNPHSNLCLDDKNSGTNNGNQIWVYTCNGTGAQKWTVN